MKPLIGITCEVRVKPDKPWNRSSLQTTYTECVERAGGLAVILPPAPPTAAEDTLRRLDGLILSGGYDIPPEVLGEPPHPTVEPMPPERWESETRWLEAARALEKPVLGICLGMQIMNVVAGGTLIQDIPALRPGPVVHGDPGEMGRHDVLLSPGSRLAALAPASVVTVTSSHHQAVDRIAPPYRVAATAPDGLVEAIEDPERPFMLGVQWHPERGSAQPDWLLEAFVRHCAG